LSRIPCPTEEEGLLTNNERMWFQHAVASRCRGALGPSIGNEHHRERRKRRSGRRSVKGWEGLERECIETNVSIMGFASVLIN
jgi:hypothetical protein